jgi:hypothetical protein
MPIDVLAYDEAMAEIVICSDPGVIIQNQSYRTSTRQTLFHTANNALTDTEAFAFSGFSPAGIQLAQTTAATAVGSDTGFFTSTASSDIVAPLHIGNGFLGTWIGDPIRTGAPFFAGLMLPQMTKVNPVAMASPAAGLQPVIHYDLNKTLSNESARSAAAGNATAANGTKQNASATKPASKPADVPSPFIKPGEPFYHQQNKPFSAALTAPSGPFKLTQAQAANTTGFDRFLRNTVGRSTTDKAFDGTTSSPTYIHPADALAVQIPYDFIQGARGMTMPGTHLNYRAWPL